MARLALEIADIFHAHGPAWRSANVGHLSLGQLKVMSAIEHCRTAAFGGHVARCEKCANTQIAYNSCRKPGRSFVGFGQSNGQGYHQRSWRHEFSDPGTAGTPNRRIPSPPGTANHDPKAW